MTLSKQQLLMAYRCMKTIRQFEEQVHVEFAAGNLPGFVHLYAGEEACAVGVCSHLLRLTYRFQGRDFRLTDVAGKVMKPWLA